MHTRIIRIIVQRDILEFPYLGSNFTARRDRAFGACGYFSLAASLWYLSAAKSILNLTLVLSATPSASSFASPTALPTVCLIHLDFLAEPTNLSLSMVLSSHQTTLQDGEKDLGHTILYCGSRLFKIWLLHISLH